MSEANIDLRPMAKGAKAASAHLSAMADRFAELAWAGACFTRKIRAEAEGTPLPPESWEVERHGFLCRHNDTP